MEHLNITQTEPEQRIGKAYQGTAKNRHIVHCAQTAGSADVTVQNTFHGRNNITCITDCKYGTATTLYTVGTWFVLGMLLQIPCTGDNKDDDDDDDNNNNNNNNRVGFTFLL